MLNGNNTEKVPLLGNVTHRTIETDPRKIHMNSDKSGSYQYTRDTKGMEFAISERQRRRDMSISFNEVLEPITLTWQDISVYAPLPSPGWRKRDSGPHHKQILYDVSGVVQPGTLLAIIGASGAGKTTLLNVLTYRNRGNLIVDGDVRVNGGRIGKGMPSMSAYIQQEDLFIGTLTVNEHLWFQSQLRMDKDVPSDIRRMRVEKVMKEMSLTKCKDVVIGIPGKLKGISGGEKKRLTFASEVLTNPPLLFCDEPTSGLDSYMARNIVTTMKLMASKGRTILCTIHQPSSEVFALFDRVLLVAEGRTAYLGPAKQALSFFEQRGYPCPVNYNPADHYVLTLAVVPGEEHSCRERIKGICDSYDNSPYGENTNQNIKEAHIMEDGIMYDEEAFPNVSPYKAPWFKQFLVVLWRSWVSVKREPGVFKTRILQALILSSLFGCIYFGQILDQQGVQNMNGALFLMINQMTFGFVFAVIHAFPPEFPIFLREHHDGMYRVDVYFLAKTLAEMPQFIIIPFIFTTVMYWLVGFYQDFLTYILCVIILFLVCNVAVSLGYCLSSCSSNPSFVLALGPIFVVPVMAIGGFFINSGSIPAAFLWLKYVSWFTYSNELLVINQWQHVDNITCVEELYVNGTLLREGDTTCFKTGQDIIKSQNFNADPGHIAFDYLMLLVLLVGFRIIAFFFLLIRSRRKFKTNKPKPPAQIATGPGSQC